MSDQVFLVSLNYCSYSDDIISEAHWAYEDIWSVVK